LCEAEKIERIGIARFAAEDFGIALAGVGDRALLMQVNGLLEQERRIG
jgi:hypothetical protein